MTYAFVDLNSAWGTLGAVVIVSLLGNTRLKDDRVHQAVGRIHYGSQHTVKIVEKHAVGVCPRLAAFHSKP